MLKVLLLGMNMDFLQETYSLCREARPGLAVELHCVDLSIADKEIFQKVIKKYQRTADHDIAMLQR